MTATPWGGDRGHPPPPAAESEAPHSAEAPGEAPRAAVLGGTEGQLKGNQAIPRRPPRPSHQWRPHWGRAGGAGKGGTASGLAYSPIMAAAREEEKGGARAHAPVPAAPASRALRCSPQRRAAARRQPRAAGLAGGVTPHAPQGARCPLGNVVLASHRPALPT